MTFSPVMPLLASGLIAILGQVILLRELSVAFYGNELIYVYSLGIWIFWTAVGAIIKMRPRESSSGQTSLLLCLTGPLLILTIMFIRGNRALPGGIPGAYLPFFTQILVTTLALFPIAFLTGFIFSWAAKLYIFNNRAKNALGIAYALESAGGLLGGLLATLCFHVGIQNLPLALCCGFLMLLIPLFSGVLPNKPWMKQGYRLIITAAAVLLAWQWPFADLDLRMTRWTHPHAVASRDTPYGRITLTDASGQTTLFENDTITYESEGTDAEAFIHPLALQHGAPRKILLLGGGVEGLLLELLKHRPERIDYVELNSEMLAMAVGFLPASVGQSIHDPRVHVTHGDPRQFLKGSGLYDLIIVGMPEPHSGQANRFYSREFFQQCKARLNPGGILGFRLKSAENFWTPPMMLRMGSIYLAVRSVFPECVFLPGMTNVITASFSPLPRSSPILAERWSERGIKSSLVNPPYLSYLYANDRFGDIRQRLEITKAPVNRDLRPVCYQFSTMIWLAKFFPRLNAFEYQSPFPHKGILKFLPPLILFLVTFAGFSICRRSPAARRFALMASAAFVGMVLETVLILHYQIKYGVLYQDIGALLTSFMTGLALGALGFSREKPHRAWGSALVMGFLVLTGLVYGRLVLDLASGLVPTMGLICLSGLFVSAVFTFASSHEVSDQTTVVSPLYASDLAGGCLGSLVSGLLLIPFFGLDITVLLMIIINLSLIRLEV